MNIEENIDYINSVHVVNHSTNLKKSVEKYGYYGSMNRPKNYIADVVE